MFKNIFKVTLFSLISAFLAVQLRLAAPLERAWTDYLFWARNYKGINKLPDPDIALLCLDDEFYAYYNKEPLKRIDIARMVNRVFKAGAQFVYLDIFFRKENSYGEDPMVKEIFDKYRGRLIFPEILRYDSSMNAFLANKSYPGLSKGHISGYVNFPDPDKKGYIKDLRFYSDQISNVLKESGGFEQPLMPVSYVIASLLNKAGSTTGLVGSGLGSVRENMPINFFYAPQNTRGLIDFIQPAKAGELLDDNLFTALSKEVYKNKAVIIGDTSRLGKDWFNSPVGRISGVELIAAGAASLRAEIKLEYSKNYYNLLLAVGAALVISFLCFNSGTFFAFSGLILLSGLILWSGAGLFIFKGLIINPVMAFTAAFFCWISGLALLNQKWSEMGIYVSKFVKKKVLTGLFQKGLAKKRLAVLFADIRGFTNLSDTLDGEIIIRILGDYFDEMALILTQKGIDGTLDKFMGDGIMAFFGDPYECENPCTNAVKAAGLMVGAFEGLKEKWIAQGLLDPLLKQENSDSGPDLVRRLGIGIGIATGHVYVGNMGSCGASFMDYTCIGREVNLASRLESMAPPNSVLLCAQTVSSIDGHDGLSVSVFGEKSINVYKLNLVK
jgi:class 3 adenylate cyclase/CHASE2 domain-containing sensor protein